MVLVSIVVPIHKVEKYLRQCVDSLLGQTLADIEVILVDDGSPDACPAIVDEYAAKDTRVVSIHQANGGYGKAVNAGIARARAPYIGIIESDDWVEPTMFAKLHSRAVETGADLVKCMFWKHNSLARGKKRDVLYTEPAADLRDAPEGVFSPVDWEPIFIYHSSLWCNLYRADLLRAVPFMETAGAAYQDFPFTMEILARAKSMSIVKEPLLHYRSELGQNSSTMSHCHARFFQALAMTRAAEAVMLRYGLLPRLQEAWYLHVFNANIWAYVQMQGEQQAAFASEFRELLRPAFLDTHFRWQYFTPAERRAARRIAAATPQEQAALDAEDAAARAQYPTLRRRYRIARLRSLLAIGARRRETRQTARSIRVQIRAFRDF